MSEADAYARCAEIARSIMEQASKDSTASDDSDVAAAACWKDCAAQILWEIEAAARKELAGCGR